jgi:hypothetical protein
MINAMKTQPGLWETKSIVWNSLKIVKTIFFSGVKMMSETIVVKFRKVSTKKWQ